MIFSAEGLNAINNEINQIHQALVDANSCDVTSDDLMELFVEPAHRASLSEAWMLLGKNRQVEYIRNGPRRIWVTLYSSNVGDGFLFPKYMCNKQPSPTASAQAHERFEEWFAGAQALENEILTLKCCIGYLSERLSHASQYNFFLPGMIALMRGPEDENASNRDTHRYKMGSFSRGEFSRFSAARKLIVAGKRPKDFPAVPPSIRAACRCADALLLRYSLLSAKAQRSGHKKEGVFMSLQTDCKVVMPPPWAEREIDIVSFPTGYLFDLR